MPHSKLRSSEVNLNLHYGIFGYNLLLKLYKLDFIEIFVWNSMNKLSKHLYGLYRHDRIIRMSVIFTNEGEIFKHT